MNLTARVRTLDEIGKCYRELFPERYAEALRIVKEARDQLITADGVSKDGRLSWRVRIPTEIFIFIRRWIPDFAENYGDIELLRKVWPDLAVGKDHSKQYWTPTSTVD